MTFVIFILTILAALLFLILQGWAWSRLEDD